MTLMMDPNADIPAVTGATRLMAAMHGNILRGYSGSRAATEPMITLSDVEGYRKPASS